MAVRAQSLQDSRKSAVRARLGAVLEEPVFLFSTRFQQLKTSTEKNHDSMIVSNE